MNAAHRLLIVARVLRHIGWEILVGLLWVWAVLGAILCVAVTVGTLRGWAYDRRQRKARERRARLAAIREYENAVADLYDQALDTADFAAWEAEVSA